MRLSDKQTAASIARLIEEYSTRLDEALGVVQERGTAEEFVELREPVSRILTIGLTEILNPIYFQYPDLEPPELRKARH